MRYIIWQALWEGPRLKKVEADSPQEAFRKLGYGDAVDKMEELTDRPGKWEIGDDVLHEADTQEKIDDIARSLLDYYLSVGDYP